MKRKRKDDGKQEGKQREAVELHGAVEMKGEIRRRSGFLHCLLFTTEQSALSEGRTQINTDYHSFVKQGITSLCVWGTKKKRERGERQAH